MRKIRQKPGEDRIAYLRKAARYCRRRFKWHRTEGDHRHCHPSFAADAAMEDAEKLYVDLESFGVEGDCEENGEDHITIQYLNMGDTYAATICYYHGRFQVTSWGDIVERRR